MPRSSVLIVPVALSAIGALLTVGAAASSPAQAPGLAPPTSRVIADGVQSGEGYDVKRVRLASAVEGEKRAVVRVRFADTHEVGLDGVDVWFDIDRDKRPDAVLTAYPDSEYYLSEVDGWRDEGDEITDEGCVRARNRDDQFVIRFNPHCLATPKAFRVAVMGFRYDEEGYVARDWAPARRTLSKRVLSYTDAD